MKIVKVVAAVIRKGDKIFATARGYGEFKGQWEFPGGKIEKNETPQQALKREFKEELNVDIEVHELITSIVDEYETQILHIDTYVCSLLSGEPTLNEHINKAWSSKESIDSLVFSPADKPTLDIIKNKYLK